MEPEDMSEWMGTQPRIIRSHRHPKASRQAQLRKWLKPSLGVIVATAVLSYFALGASAAPVAIPLADGSFNLNCAVVAGNVTSCTNPAVPTVPSPMPSATPSSTPVVAPPIVGPPAPTATSPAVQPSATAQLATAPAATSTPVVIPPATAAAPMPTTPAPVPPAATAATYSTSGRFLNDPAGNRVVVRGVEQVLWNANWLSPSFVTEIGKTGANTVRILPHYLQATPTGEPKATLAQIEDAIRRGINAHMLVEVALDGGKDHTVYLRPEVKALLFKYQKHIAIHARGEANEGSENGWRNNTINVVTAMRNAGYTAPLYLMSNAEGRNLPTLLNQGAAVVAADPLHNVVFGWQAYWGSPDNYYQNLYGMSLEQAFAKAGAAAFPIQVGLMWRTDIWQDANLKLDYIKAMDLAKQHQLGWLWWDWRMGSDNLTTDGQFGSWAGTWGAVVAARIAAESVRTPWQLATAI